MARVRATRCMVIPAARPDNARSSMGTDRNALGTRLRDEGGRNAFNLQNALSRQRIECVAHDGGHDGHLADARSFGITSRRLSERFSEGGWSRK